MGLALLSLGILVTGQTDNHAGMALDMRNIDLARHRYCLKNSINLTGLNPEFAAIHSCGIKRSSSVP